MATIGGGGSARIRVRDAVAAGGLLTLLMAALTVYQPWRAVPLEMIDFSEFIPLLRGTTGYWDAVGELLDYYRGEHGRLNLLSYAVLAAKWSLFGEDPVGWQWARVVEMSLLAMGSMALLLRLRLRPAGALIGTALFMWSSAAVDAWTRLTAAEPYGLVLMIGAALLAIRQGKCREWRLNAVGVAIFVGAGLFVKEMLIGWVPAIWLLGIASRTERGKWRVAPWTARSLWLTVAVTSVVFTVGVAAVVTLLSAPGEGFATAYGSVSLSIERWSAIFAAMAFPAIGWALLPNLLFGAIVASGVITALLVERYRGEVGPIVLIALAFPIVGATLYLPWPYYDDFYGLPYLFGPALVLAFAISVLSRQWPRVVGVVDGASLVLVAMLALTAQPVASRLAALQQLNKAIADTVLEYPGVDSLVVVVGRRTPQAWAGAGATLRRYALLDDPTADLPKGVEATCGELDQARSLDGPILVVDGGGGCIRGTPVERHAVSFTRISWWAPHVVRDSVWASVHRLERLRGGAHPPGTFEYRVPVGR